MHILGITQAPRLPILNLPVLPQVAGSLLSTLQDATGVAVPEADSGGKRVIDKIPSLKNIAALRVNHRIRNAGSGEGGAGQLNVITKSGTCDFLASACESFCSDLWLR